LLAAANAAPGATGIGYSADESLFFRHRNIAAEIESQTNLDSFIGISRATSTEYTARYGGANTTFTRASETPFNGTVAVFTEGSQLGFKTNARLAFYSIGESLPDGPTKTGLELLDERVSALITAIENSTQLDPDAAAYIAAVEAADEAASPGIGVLETGVREAINTFVVRCKSDGIWDAIKASCILAGAKTLDGALVPLAGGAPTNNNFVDADYDRETGLVGDANTKYLLSNLAYNAISTNNEHLSLYRSTALSQDSNGIGGGTVSPISISRIAYVSGTNRYELQDNASATYGTISYTGFVGISRYLSTDFVYRDNGSSVGVARNSLVRANTSTPYGVFCANYSDLGLIGLTDARLAFYSIGESLDLAALDTHVSDLITAIGAAIL